MKFEPKNRFIFKREHCSVEVTEESDYFYVTLRPGKGFCRPGEPPMKLSIAGESWEEAKQNAEKLSHIIEGTFCAMVGEYYEFPAGLERAGEQMPAFLHRIINFQPSPGMMSN
jgi:hypothetical protein